MAKTRKYDKFPAHIDNALERVQGDTINKIQKSINDLQIDTSILYEKSFLNECIFVLDNNPTVNYMFYMDLENLDEVFKARSSDFIQDKEARCVSIDSSKISCILHSVEWKSKYGAAINNFILKVDSDIPRGSTIKYYISNDLQNYYPIKPGESIPKKFPVTFQSVYLKAELIANRIGESPRLFGAALLCQDKLLEINSVVLDPDNPNIIINPGDDIIIDGEESVSGETTLMYDDNGLLQQVLTANGNIVELNYVDNKLEGIISSSPTMRKTVTLIREGGILKHVLTNKETV